MENAKRRGVPGEVSLLLAAVIWGGAFVAQSLGGDSLGPLSFNASRSLIGALALVPVILWNDRKQGTGRPKGRERRLLWLGGALCGICLTLAVNLQQVAIAWVDASGRANVGKIGFLTTTYIVLVPILSLFLKKRVGANVYAGILLALAGMYLLCVKEGFALGGGDVYALLAALMFALQIIVIDIFAPKVDNIRLSALQFLVCGALSGALALGTETQSARAYRDALDGADKAEISRHKKRMLDMFDRGGGCTGYFYGDNAHTGCIAVSDRSKELIEEAANSYAKDTRKQPVDMELYMRVGEAARLAMRLGGDNVEAVGDVVQPAQKPQTAERYMEQARKLGDTPFICAGIRADIDEKAFLPMSAVNALRRDASAKLLESLHWRRSCDSGDAPKLKKQPAEHTLITAIASTLDQAKAAFGAGADEVALEPWEFHIAAFEAAAAFKGSKKLLISLPVAIISHKEAEKIMKIIGSGLIDGGIAANVGQLELIRSLPLRIAGTQMNAMNGYTVQAYKDMGFDRVTLSLELTKPQLRDISGAGTAVSIYGRAQLMQLRHCPVKEYRGCRSCDGFTGKMVDEGGREFPLCNVRQEDGCLVRLLNCLPTDITDLYGELPEPEAVQLAFYDEAPEKVRERIAAAMAARDGRKVSPAKNATRGHWNRAVD